MSSGVNTTGPKRAIQTDVSRPARLPSGKLGLGNVRAGGQSSTDGSGKGGAGEGALLSQQHLDTLAENANKMIDEEISALLEGFKSIIQLSTVADKDEVRITQDNLQMQHRADSMVRAAQNLLLLSKALSLSLLLSKVPSSEAMQEQTQALLKSTEEHRTRSAALVHNILETLRISPEDPQRNEAIKPA